MTVSTITYYKRFITSGLTIDLTSEICKYLN